MRTSRFGDCGNTIWKDFEGTSLTGKIDCGGGCKTIGVLLALLVLLPPCAAAEKTSITTDYADVNGTRLYYEVAGKGDPVVLIHGGFMDNRMWDYQFGACAKNFRIIRYDLRGAGRSRRNYKEGYSQVEDLYELLRHLKVEKAHIIGLSMGGELAIDFTLSHPEIVLSLTAANAGLSGVPFSGEGMGVMRRVFKAAAEEGLPQAVDLLMKAPLFSTVAKNNKQATEKIRVMLEDNAHFLQGGNANEPLKPPAGGRLAEIRVPTLIILSELNDEYGKTVAVKLEEGVAGSKKVVISQAGHMVNMEKPKEFNKAVLSFLRSLNR